MKHHTLIISILIGFICVGGLFGDKRHPPVPMKELKNSSGPSYVPFPYPKTRYQILEDLKHGIAQLVSNEIGDEPLDESSKDQSMSFLPEFVRPDSQIQVVEIAEVKNKISGMSQEKSLLIVLFNPGTKHFARVAMDANGLLIGGLEPSRQHMVKPLKSKDRALIMLEEHNESLERNRVKTIQLKAFNSMLADLICPSYEVVLDDGTTYYISYDDSVYQKVRTKKVTGEKGAFLLSEKSRLKKGQRIIFDSLNDSAVILEKLRKTKD